MNKKLPVIIAVIAIVSISVFYTRLSKITERFGYSPKALASQLYLSWRLATKTNLSISKNPSVLLLGIDERHDLLEKTMVTDTIMLANLNLQTAQFSLVSLPRDLWLEKYKLKINQLYPYSLKNNLNPYDFLKSEFREITGQNIDFVLIINTATFQKVSEIIGPVNVNLPYELIDTRYPNPEYIKNPKAGLPIYQTIHFQKGDNTINKDNVLPFVRSRKGSDDPNLGGTDLGRIQRQQILLEAYLAKLKSSPQLDLVAKLYQLFKSDIKTDIENENIFYYLFGLKSPQNLSIKRINIPVNGKDGLLFEPNYLVSSQSVILPKDNSWKQLSSYLQTQLR